jgi:hypothetical protein
MKKFILMFMLVAIALGAMAQRGKIQTLTVDTLKGNNNKILGSIPVTGAYESLLIEVKVDRISTAAGGTLYLRSGLTTAGVLVNNQTTNPSVGFAPNDTLTTADAATQYWQIYIKNPEALVYQIYGDGDANDTIKITTKYFLK